MTRRTWARGLVALFGIATMASAEEPPTYERDLKPFLAKRCAACHNAKKVDNVDVSGGLALDTYEAVTGVANGHKVVVPGKASESELFRRLVETDEDRRMPLSEKPLAPPQQDLVRRWIEAGAPRGEILPEPPKPTTRPVRRFVRSLDVRLPVEAKVPPDLAKLGAKGAIELSLKVGPLPAVSSLAFRGDGRFLAVGTYGAVVVWDLVDARPALILTDVPGPVHALVFSRDGRRLAVGSGLPARSGSVRVYDVPGGTRLHDFEGHDDVVFGLAFRPDGGQLASASFDQTVRLWDLGRGRASGRFQGHSDFVYDLAYTPDGRSLLSVSKDRTIKRVDVGTQKETRTYSGYNEDILALAIQPGGAKFVTSGHEPQLRWWAIDAEAPDLQAGGHGGPVHQLAFSGNGTRLISAGGDGSVRVWDGKSGAFLRVLAGTTEWQYAAALSHDARIAAAGGWDGLVRVWETETGKLLATLLQPPSDDSARVEWLALAPGGAFSSSRGLESLLRWRIGGVDAPRDVLAPLFAKPEDVAGSLRGESPRPTATP